MSTVKTNHRSLLQSDECLEYLNKRQVSIAAIEKFQLGYEERRISRLRDRLLFPLFDQYGFHIGFQGRALRDEQISKTFPKFWHTEGIDKSRYLYGLYENQQQIVDDGYAVLLEGNFDVIISWQCGIPAVASMGTAFTWQQALLLRRYTDTVIICPDNDKAGTIAAENRVKLLKEYGFNVYVAWVNKKVKDIDDVYQSRGKNGVQNTIFNAQIC